MYVSRFVLCVAASFFGVAAGWFLAEFILVYRMFFSGKDDKQRKKFNKK